MTEKNRKPLDNHVEFLGWLHIIGNLVMLAIGFIGFFFLTGLGQIVGDPVAFRVLNLIGTIGVFFFAVLALPGIIAGYGLLKHRRWARLLALVVGLFSLFNVPVGTAIGVYTFWVLLQPDVEDIFISPEPG